MTKRKTGEDDGSEREKEKEKEEEEEEAGELRRRRRGGRQRGLKERTGKRAGSLARRPR
jgi:hypothetical protein